jgi:hypothetical protein
MQKKIPVDSFGRSMVEMKRSSSIESGIDELNLGKLLPRLEYTCKRDSI